MFNKRYHYALSITHKNEANLAGCLTWMMRVCRCT